MSHNIHPWQAMRLLVTSFLITTVIGGCSDRPTAPQKALAVTPRLNVTPSGQKYLDMATPSDQLAKTIQGFGGAFVSDGALNVYLTQDAFTNNDVQVTARITVNQLFADMGRPEMPVKFLRAQHSFIQLRVWETTLRELYPSLGVHTAGIDEWHNRLEIVVRDISSLRALSDRLTTLGVPTTAVASRVGSEGEPFVTLANKVRPTRGGLSILTMFSYGGVAYRYGCTYGFNTQINGTRYMVTNAHCVEPTNVWGGLIGAQVSQPDSNVASLVGYVTSNPSAFTGLGCAAGHTCRNSDAVLVSTTGLTAPNWDLGGIAQTINRVVGPYGGGSITINSTTPRIGLSGTTMFYAGDTLEKIGATTGWTAGVVTATCTYHATGTFGRVCDGVVAAGANHGDSGSPVFWKASNGTYFLTGILWGGPGAIPGGTNSSEFWFSRFSSIKDDLSPFSAMTVN